MKWAEDAEVLWGDDSLGAIYMFEDGGHLGTIPVMAWKTPWWPSVQPWREGIAVVSYRWPDRDDRSPDDALAVFLGQVHHVLNGKADLVYETQLRLDFEDGGAVAVVPHLVLVTNAISDGRKLLLKVTCRVPRQAGRPPEVEILDAVDWNAKTGKFEESE
ncbi:MAG: hypothetical protein ACYS8X_11840 [Planctomycetota bacterium]